jgi:hypothetical protein
VFAHFRKATRSYRPYLFARYDVEGLPRTNNELEQSFGSYRYHERRRRGRKVACPGTVVRGSVRLVAAATTRLRPVEPGELAPRDLAAWRELRASLERRRAVRALGRRFRHDPDAYLKSLEDMLINQALPTWALFAGSEGGAGGAVHGVVSVVGSRLRSRGPTARRISPGPQLACERSGQAGNEAGAPVPA